MNDLWMSPDRVQQAATAAMGVADQVPTKVANVFQTTEECAWQHRDLASGSALGSDLQTWSDQLANLSATIGATSQELSRATRSYLDTDMGAATDLNHAADDLNFG